VCAGMSIPFRKPTVFPRDGLLAARVAYRFAEANWIGAFVRSVFTANFGEDRDIAKVDAVEDILENLGQRGSAVIEQAQSRKSKAGLREQTEKAVRRGIFGAPSVRVGDELFWGNDRLEDAFNWYERGAGWTNICDRID
ncbi:MAG: 2-hydroxychromene-2-carboxylate isomerase, partial [Candidatus Binatia bacterium]